MNNIVEEFYLPSLEECKITIMGLGYVGIEVALGFGSISKNLLNNKTLNRKIIGFDTDERRINELISSYDRNMEVSEKRINEAKFLEFTNNTSKLIDSDIFIVTVPTPIDLGKNPDLNPLINVSKMIGGILKKRAQTLPDASPCIVIFESTVYPGATEEVCTPIIEKESCLKYNQKRRKDTFFTGYSPERINPGDKLNNFDTISKVTSGSNISVANWVNNLYGSVIKAGTYKASSIKVAEASKIVENVQRDINIALMNEFAIIFNKLNISCLEVIDAAKTKWNFLNFRPGLVGGHCIGVDPYYLTYKSKLGGYYPDMISTSRRINDNMSNWISELIINNLITKNLKILEQNILLLGLSFKADTNDIRNSKVFEVYNKLHNLGVKCHVFDPYIESKTKDVKSINLIEELPKNKYYTCAVVLVDHKLFKSWKNRQWQDLIKENGFIIDLHGIVPKELKAIII